MTDEITTTDEPLLSATEREQLDQACDTFESHWQQHTLPKLEDALAGRNEPLRSVLFAELLKIEIYWRTQAGDNERLRSELLQRFPEGRTTIEQILGTEQTDKKSLAMTADSLGHFENLEKIGDGGFGIVFRAWDARHQRYVALKIPRFVHQLAGRELEEFFREAKAAGSLDHPNIARVWDSGTTAGVTYIAYQLVEGENLKVRLSEFRELTPMQIVGFVRQLAEAVDYAHQQGIIHRDIKPSNVLLASENQPVLTDFGLALAVGGDATRSLAARIGTLDYMSPEQATGAQDAIDHRTDLWSLGVLLYELLTGESPFRGATDLELCQNICNGAFRRLRQLRRGVPKDLEIVVERCLQKRPDDRLSSCGELADELARIESGHPIHSRQVSFVERSWRWCQRNPRPVFAFAAILAATVFGSWSWGLRLAENQQNENVVQQLQLQLEVKNVERRDLLSQLLRADATKVSLLEQDYEFLVGRMLTSDDEQEQLLCLEILVRNEQLQPQRFSVGSPQRTAVSELLKRLRETTSDPRLQTQIDQVASQLKL